MNPAAPLLPVLLALQDPAPPAPAPAPPGQRVHLVELFTSQACQSCPAADALVGNLGRHGVGTDQAVAISWHVDLWDDDAFKDPYVVKEAGKRQRDYARSLQCATYTPMAVVDGRRHLVGSNHKALLRALAGRDKARIGLAVHVDGGRVRIAVEGAPAAEFATLELHAVLVEDGVVTRIAAGENAGKEVRENGVVRAVLKHGALAQLGREVAVAIDLRRAKDPVRCAVVVFVQEGGAGEVLQAVRTPLPPPGAPEPVSQVPGSAQAPVPAANPASRPSR